MKTRLLHAPRRLRRSLACVAVLAGGLMAAPIASAAPPPPSISGGPSPTLTNNWTTPFTITGITSIDLITPNTVDWKLTPSGQTGSGLGSTTVGPFALTDGSYTLHATQTDIADILDPTSPEATRSFTIDTTPPTVSITAPANGAAVAGNVSVTMSASDANGVAAVVVFVDGSPVALPWNSRSVFDGPHTITARAFDNAGNFADSSVVVNVDNSPPLGGQIVHASPSGGVPGFSNTTSISIGMPIAPTDATPPITFRLSQSLNPPTSGFSAAAFPRTTSLSSTEGPQTLKLWARDGLGNIGLAATTVVTYDKTAPSAASSSVPKPGPNLTTSFAPLGTLTLTFSEAIQDPSALVKLCEDPCGSPIPITVSFDPVNPVTMLVRPNAPLNRSTRYELRLPLVRDLAGNTLSGPGVSQSSWTFTTSADNVPPGPVSGLTLTPGIGQITLGWTPPGDADLGRITVLRNTSPPSGAGDATAARFGLPASARSFTDVGLAPGVTYHYAVYTEDVIGNTGTLLRTSGIPKGPPAILGVSFPAAPKTINASVMRPKAGAVVKTLRPILRWKRVRGAIFYNIQLRVNGRQIVKAFPRKAIYQVRKGKLKPSRRVAWYVFAYIGAKRKYVRRPMISWFDTSPVAKP